MTGSTAGIGETAKPELTVNLAKWEESLGEVFLDIPEDEMPVRMEPDADGVFVPEASDSRWDEMPLRQPTGGSRNDPPQRAATPTFSDPDPPGYSGP